VFPIACRGGLIFGERGRGGGNEAQFVVVFYASM